MPSSNRLYRVAIRGCLAAAILTLGAHALGAEKQDTKQPATQTQAKPEAQPQPNIVLDTSIFRSIFDDAVKIFSAEKTANESAERRKEAREQSDLNAQWVMAIAAAIVIVFSFLQLIVSGFTLWFLRETFGETRRTAKAGIESARAARRSVWESARAATASEDSVKWMVRVDRPYIVPSDIRLEKFDAPVGERGIRLVQVFLKLLNIGTTPAFIKGIGITEEISIRGDHAQKL